MCYIHTTLPTVFSHLSYCMLTSILLYVFPGPNSNGDVEYLVQTLYPVLLKYQVDAYVCGHDHFLEVRLSSSGDGTEGSRSFSSCI